MTIVIPTCQRRAPLERLLAVLTDQARSEPDLATGLDIVVVVDGSSDGTVEMLDALELPVPLQAVWQTNAGPASARNTGLARVRGRLTWFLDDDMVPAPGVLRRHRSGHRPDRPGLLMGPCEFPPEWPVVPANRAWAEIVHRELREQRRVTSPDLVSFANTSGAQALYERLGGFETGFEGWGGEDFELGYRFLRAGVEIRFDPDAAVWHHQQRTLAGMLATKVDEGRNTVHIVRLHPELIEMLVPSRAPSGSRRLVRGLRLHRPTAARWLARIMTLGAVAEQALSRGASRRLFDLAAESCMLAGLASLDHDGRLVHRFLG